MLAPVKLATVLTAMILPGAFGTALPNGQAFGGKVSGADIVGGTPVTPGSFPPIVAAVNVNENQFCAGFLLNEHTVVIAAHCVYGASPSRFSVRVGSLYFNSGGLDVAVSDILTHPNVTFDPIVDNDIALLKLSDPVHQSSTIHYATLPSQGFSPSPGANTIVAGWGNTCYNCSVSEPLQQIAITVVDHDTCQASMGKDDSPVTKNMFCAGDKAGDKGACFGDSGTPAVDAKTGVVWGLVSWIRNGATCTGPDLYDVFVSIGSYVDWIHENKF